MRSGEKIPMIYSGIAKSKSAAAIPLFKSGKPSHSKYCPEAEQILIPQGFEGCAVVAGIAGGFHIKNLLSRKGISLVIAAEADAESLAFCRSLETVRAMEKNARLILCDKDALAETLCKRYIPSLYKNLTLAFQRAWKDENESCAKEIEAAVQKSLETISADFSVQAHFGKIWQRNILLNLQFMSENAIPAFSPEGMQHKTAAIIAAGPSLDKSAAQIKGGGFFVVSTDTAYGTLLRSGIEPDAVVSIDAQHVSSEHFFCCKPEGKTLFVFDICANPEAVRLVFSKGNRIKFVRSSHPLSAAAAEACSLPLIEPGAGTVTVAAADWARQAGFRKMQFFGADFAYSFGKPYAKGTYLEKQSMQSSFRLNDAETQFSSLMFRTALEKASSSRQPGTGTAAHTTAILKSYRQSLSDWAQRHSFKSDGTGTLYSGSEKAPSVRSSCGLFSYRSFLTDFLSGIKKLMNTECAPEDFLSDKWGTALLPFLSFFKDCPLSDSLSRAYNHVLRYKMPV